jgi:hypothetical protein
VEITSFAMSITETSASEVMGCKSEGEGNEGSKNASVLWRGIITW